MLAIKLKLAIIKQELLNQSENEGKMMPDSNLKLISPKRNWDLVWKFLFRSSVV